MFFFISQYGYQMISRDKLNSKMYHNLITIFSRRWALRRHGTLTKMPPDPTPPTIILLPPNLETYHIANLQEMLSVLGKIQNRCI